MPTKAYKVSSRLCIQWNLRYPDLYCPDTSIVWTAQIGFVACSLLTIMKFGLDETTRREPVCLLGDLCLIITTMYRGDFIVCLLTAQY